MPSPLSPRLARMILGMAVFSCVLAPSAGATTYAVGTCTSFNFFATIQLAVNYAAAGSTIYICPGTYAEQVLITKNLTLKGVGANGLPGSSATGANNPVIVPPAGGMVANATDLYDGSSIAAQIAVVTPAGITIPIKVYLNSISVDGANNGIAGCGPPSDLVGIYYQNASGTLDYVSTRNQVLTPADNSCQSGQGIFVQSGYGTGGTAAVIIENNSVHNYQKNGITADGSGTTATISGNFVVGQGPTTGAPENGIQVSDGANGTLSKNTVTNNIYTNPPSCSPCYGASGILVYDSGATSLKPLTIDSNNVSNTQLAVMTYGDSGGTADFNNVSNNKITGMQTAGSYLNDGIDLCSNDNTASSNTVFDSSGAAVHIDSTCTESTGATGNNTSVRNNVINEACAGVLLGNGTNNNQFGNASYDVVQVTQSGDVCPSGTPAGTTVKLKPQPAH